MAVAVAHHFGFRMWDREDENLGWRPWSDGIGTEVGDASGEGLESMEWALWGRRLAVTWGPFPGQEGTGRGWAFTY